MFTWILGGAAVCIVLAAILHFALPSRGGKVPAVIMGTVGGFAAGAVLGILGAVYYGESVQKTVYGSNFLPEPLPSGGPAMKGVNSPPAAQSGPAPAAKKKSDDAPKGGGPGSPNMPGDYPGFNDFTKKKAQGDAPVPKVEK